MLNLNYTLLSERANSKYTMIEPYIQTESSYAIYSDGYLINQLINFNQIIKESTIELNNIYNNDNYYINESTIIEKVVNGVKFIISKVVEAIKNIYKTIIGFFQQILNIIKNKASNVKDEELEKKYREVDRIRILRQALYNASQEDSTVFIGDLNPTPDLLNKDFPDTSIIGSDLIKMTTDALNSYIYTHKANNELSGASTINNAEASESLANYLENQKDAILLKMFGKYSYDPNDPLTSVRIIANKAYGPSDQKDTRLTVDLYLLACDNLTRSKEIINNITNDINTVKKSYDEITKSLDKVSNELQSKKSLKAIGIEYSGDSTIKDDSDRYNSRFTEEYRNNVNRLIQNINRILNTVNQVIKANYDLLKYKGDRIREIFDPMDGDSARVKRACHRLIKKQIGLDDDISESYYNPSDDTAEAKALESQFESSLCMIEEYWLENEYNANIMKYLTETGEGQNPTPTNGTANPAPAQNTGNQQQTQQSKMDSVQTTLKTGAKNISEFARKQAEKFNQLFDKFKETIIKGSIMTDTPFWNRNRGKIKGLGGEIAKTNVADWYEYDINRFKTKIDIKFDANAPYLNSDQEFQEAIFQKFNYTSAKFTGDDANKTFSQKMLRVFYRSYIDKDKYTALGSTDYNHDLSFGFVDDIVKNQFNGEYLNTLRENRKLLNENIKTAENAKANINNNTETQNVESKTTVKVNTTGTPAADGGTTAEVGSESALDKDDFRFNLAEHFGLVSPERIIPIYELQTQVADTARQAPDEGTKTPEQQLQTKINRYCKYMTFAISAMMTSELKAYKQYMGLYKDHFKKPKANNNQQQQNQTAQQQNQEQK